jgi:hypothetical protein
MGAHDRKRKTALYISICVTFVVTCWSLKAIQIKVDNDARYPVVMTISNEKHPQHDVEMKVPFYDEHIFSDFFTEPDEDYLFEVVLANNEIHATMSFTLHATLPSPEDPDRMSSYTINNVYTSTRYTNTLVGFIINYEAPSNRLVIAVCEDINLRRDMSPPPLSLVGERKGK